MKINVSIQETKTTRSIRRARKFRLHIDASAIRHIHTSKIRNYSTSIAEHPIHRGLVMDGWRIGQNQ